MLNKLEQFLRLHTLVEPGDTLICAVSGGADSVAMLFGFYLLKDKLGITLSAAHFNHHLRGEESDRDEAFVRSFCQRYDIELHVGSGYVKAGKKGLEAAAREARYGFLTKLSGKIATAHTADDNAETVLMHMIRGTGLRGLGGIAPQCGNLIRPMLNITRQEVLSFLEEYHLAFVQDSSNDTDAFLRNRIRRHVMPLLKAENPCLAENLSAMAQRLRQDEEALAEQAAALDVDVSALRAASAAARSRALGAFLERSGVPEPESEHILLAEKLVFSPKPSARASFPGDITIGRNYDRLELLDKPVQIAPTVLPCPSDTTFPELGIRVVVAAAEDCKNNNEVFTVVPEGTIVLRSRKAGDTMRLPGGTKDLKKLFIDRKIPASKRDHIPVICDEKSVLGVYGIGVNRSRAADKLPAVTIRFINI